MDDLKRAKRKSFQLPSDNAIRRQIGEKAAVIRTLIEFCEGKDEYSQTLAVCEAADTVRREAPADSDPEVMREDLGYVYLIRAQGSYKIGCTRAPYRRAAEIANQSASGAELLHLISTDDPEGIESYWHGRFAEKRLNGVNKQSGKWFSLTASEVKAFKRRKFM
ncbi:MAG TPA: GIY-YIG nuclease family protein [Terracidiphilus sp.]|jgi:hypothetical protein|nr:GIY-YIG nuclease family protein [Terracidiphilus sp.]